MLTVLCTCLFLRTLHVSLLRLRQMLFALLGWTLMRSPVLRGSRHILSECKSDVGQNHRGAE
jgi:hypothetical protein